MYARVTTVQPQPGKLDEVIRITKELVLPVTQQQSGWKGLTVLVNRDANKLTTIGYWASLADVESSEASPQFREQVGKVAALLSAPPAPEVYEVNFQI
jgi:quinol monooxygenase YgiN